MNAIYYDQVTIVVIEVLKIFIGWRISKQNIKSQIRIILTLLLLSYVMKSFIYGYNKYQIVYITRFAFYVSLVVFISMKTFKHK